MRGAVPHAGGDAGLEGGGGGGAPHLPAQQGVQLPQQRVHLHTTWKSNSYTGLPAQNSGAFLSLSARPGKQEIYQSFPEASPLEIRILNYF